MDRIITVTYRHLGDTIHAIQSSHITVTKLNESNINVYSWDSKPFLYTWLDKVNGEIVWKVQETK